MDGNLISDPEEFALLVVQQFLYENRHMEGLQLKPLHMEPAEIAVRQHYRRSSVAFVQR